MTGKMLQSKAVPADRASATCRDRSRHALPSPRALRASRNNSAVVCRAHESDAASLQRRALLLGAGAAALALPDAALAEGPPEGSIPEMVEAEVPENLTKVLYGLASPPTSYGGYGGNAKEEAKYTFSYPNTWKQETVGKQEKGMVGIDSRVRNPRVKLETAFTITFGRSGEDNKRFKLGDVDTTLQGFAGADYDLQDCLVGATYKKSGKRDKDGQEFYDYELMSKDVSFLVSVSLRSGKVYALFVKAPAKVFKQDEKQLRGIIKSFELV